MLRWNYTIGRYIKSNRWFAKALISVSIYWEIDIRNSWKKNIKIGTKWEKNDVCDEFDDERLKV